ncbi:hypothetical protein Tco_0303959 [Tanacetum coccineum]
MIVSTTTYTWWIRDVVFGFEDFKQVLESSIRDVVEPSSTFAVKIWATELDDDDDQGKLDLGFKLHINRMEALYRSFKYILKFSCDNHDLSSIGNQSIECDHLNEIGMVMKLVEFISFTFE